MRIMCVDDEPLALQMLESSVKKAKPDAEGLNHPSKKPSPTRRSPLSVSRASCWTRQSKAAVT